MSSQMKHIVFILDFYHPEFSANGICAKKVIDILKMNSTISVIAIKTGAEDNASETFDGYEIHRIETKEHYLRNLSKKIEKSTKSKFLKLAAKVLFRGVQLTRYFRSFIFRENISSSLVTKYYYELSQISGQIDMIIPLCYPFESVIAAIKYKSKLNPKVKIVPYLFDKFSVSLGLHRTKWNMNLKLKRHLNLEKEMLDSSEHILASWDWENHIKTYFTKNLSQFTFTDIPSLCQIVSTTNLQFSKGITHIVYTGALNQIVRPPDYTLKVFLEIIGSSDKIFLHMYSYGNCEDKVKLYEKQSNGKIIAHGRVNIDVAHSALVQGNILLSIGNTDITQFPSKIYEYMATGKPIIHFFQDTNDPVIRLLQKYRNSLVLSQKSDSFEYNIRQVLGFIENVKDNPMVEYSEIKRQFYTATPEYVSEIINHFFDDRIAIEKTHV